MFGNLSRSRKKFMLVLRGEALVEGKIQIGDGDFRGFGHSVSSCFSFY